MAPHQKDQFTTKKGTTRIKPQYTPQATLQYKTFIKRTIVEALQNAFAGYEESLTLGKAKIGLNYSTERVDFPAVIVKFYEKTIKNAGVGHVEWGEDESNPGKFIEYKHSMYQGDIALEVYGLSSLDRDTISDAIVEVVTMGEVGPESKSFSERIYEAIGESPYSEWHFINVNSDLLSGYGEQQMIAPWIPEDTLVYQCEYRFPIMGEFYSLTPKAGPGSTALLKEVDIYPWDPSPGSTDIAPRDFPNEVVPDDQYIKIVADDKDEVEL